MKAFQTLIQDLHEQLRFKTVFVGFSGGPDSTAALSLLEEQSRRLGFQLKAVHFEHGLRGANGPADADWCERLCDERRIPFRRFDLNVPDNKKSGESVEQTARRLRLEQLTALCGSLDENGNVVALGHHADDKIENLFLRLTRGSNVSGLISPTPVTRLGILTVIRPLLNLKRDDILAYLRAKHIDQWRRDETNDDTRFLRNLIRNDVLPPLRQAADFVEKGLARSMKNLEMDKDFIESQADAAHHNVVRSNQLHIDDYRHLHPALKPRVLRRWLSNQTGAFTTPSHHLVERLDSKIESKTSGETKIIPIDGPFQARIRNGVMTLHHRNDSPPPLSPTNWDWRTAPTTRWGDWTITARETNERTPIAPDDHLNAQFDSAFIPDRLVIRSWRPGDHLVPFGGESPTKVKKLFNNANVNAEIKATTPMLCLNNEEILWIPGVKRSNQFVVTPSTNGIVHFQAAKRACQNA